MNFGKKQVSKMLAGYVLCVGLLLVSSCTQGVRTGGTVSVIAPDFFGIGENLASQLEMNLRQHAGKGGGLLMTTLVNIDDLYQTSSFGRTLTEALSTRMFRRGFGVVEVRKTAELMIKNNSGELMLSRNAELLAKELEVQAIVVGTYALTPNSVIINMKMLEVDSQEVVSVAGLEIQRSSNINHLLASSAGLAEMVLSAYEQ